MNEDILRRSIELVAERHEALRTSIGLADGVPSLRIKPAADYHLPILDLRGADDRDLAPQIKIISDELLYTDTHLLRDPLFTTRLLKLSNTDHVLLVGINHIVTDGTSSGIVRTEIETLYRRGEKQLPLCLPGPILQCGDYAVWQQQTLGSWRDNHEQFWRERAATLPRISLSFGDTRTGPDPLRWTMSEFTIGRDVLHKLGGLALKRRLLLPLLFLAIITAALSRYWEQAEWAIDFASHGRHGHPELSHTVGLLSTVLQLRFTASPDESLWKLVEQIHLDYTSIIAHQDYGRLHGLMPIGTAPVLFNWIPGLTRQPVHVSAASAVEFTPFPLYRTRGPVYGDSGEHNRPPAALGFFVFPRITGCTIGIGHQVDLLTPQSLSYLRDCIRSTAEALVTDPLMKLGSLSFAM